MNKKRFSLSCPAEKTLPAAMEVDGVCYPIRADFRVVLKLYRLFGDPEIAERHKPLLACRAFYGEKYPPDAFPRLLEWITVSHCKRDPHAPPLDFEFDADVIFASFYQQYGIDLLHIPFLHWYAFLTVLQGLGEDTPLAARLYARGRDTSKLKGKDKQSAEIAKKNAQIPRRISGEERRRNAKLVEALMNGGDVDGLLSENLG